MTDRKSGAHTLDPMDIPTYRKTLGLSQAKFAELLTNAGSPATQSLVSQWEQGAVIPAERCVEIESATLGEIQRWELRPDLWPVPPQDAASSTRSIHS